MIRLAKKELRTAAVTMFAVVFAANPVNSAPWEIGTPTLHEVFNAGGSISGNGTGLANASFTIKVKNADGDSVNTKLSGVSPDENWEDVIDPPSSGFWATRQGITPLSYQIWKNGVQLRGVVIHVNN